MPFTKFVEIGRVVLINYGSYVGHTAIILDIVNDKRVIIFGPTTGVPKQEIPIRRLSLTKFRIHDVLRGQKSGILKKKIEKFELDKKWKECTLSKKLEKQQQKEKLTDFDRFKVMILKKRLSQKIGGNMKTLKAQLKKKVESKKKPQPKKEAKKAGKEVKKSKK